jgi:UDP-N-acetylglucosamine--N-acetylmuramyl-(pentapeptide) pyrophosphoryl-undecaprenol N-acetylglucosamine transferase
MQRAPGLELLWATGPAHFDALCARLAPMDAAAWVHAVGYIDDMPRALAATDIAVSRAGAMMTAELLAWGIPSLLVPLPTAAADHQTRNARALEAAGAAVCLEESTLTPDVLWQELSALAGHEGRRARMSQAAARRARPDAARAIARELLTLVVA